MKKILLSLSLLVSLNAESFVGGYGACTDEDSWSEFSLAGVKGDMKAIEYLIGSGKCIITSAGIQISVLDRTWTGTAKVRAYAPNGQSFIVWTANENIKK